MYNFYFRSGCYDYVRVSNLSLVDFQAETFFEYNPLNCPCGYYLD